MPATLKQQVGRVIAFAGAGLGYDVVIAWFAFVLGGAGHGWGAASFAPIFGFILCPLAGVAIALRNSRVGRSLLASVVMGAVFADVLIIHFTATIDGWGHVFKVIGDDYGL
jgi:hypothetical protein